MLWRPKCTVQIINYRALSVLKAAFCPKIRAKIFGGLPDLSVLCDRNKQ
jgi:hypothetical protein